MEWSERVLFLVAVAEEVTSPMSYLIPVHASKKVKIVTFA